jgi:hypothetical protein
METIKWRGAAASSVVVEMEDAGKLLVEHLVLLALPHGRLDLEEALMPEKQETLAREVRIGFSVAICGVAGIRVGCGGVLREGFRGVVVGEFRKTHHPRNVAV